MKGIVGMDSLALSKTKNFIRQGYYVSHFRNEINLVDKVLSSFLHNRKEEKLNVVIEEKPWFPRPAAMHFKLNSLWGALKNARKFRKEI